VGIGHSFVGGAVAVAKTRPGLARPDDTTKESAMLGKQIGEEVGKVTTRRVLSVDGGPKMEVSAQSTGKLLGVATRGTVTYWAGVRPDGSLYGEAQGVVIGKGGERATFKAQGVGKLLDGGAVSYRGAQYYSSSTTKFSRLNTIAAVFEYEADADGNTKSSLWEWK
jgi:hypothetical protein